MPLIYGVLGFIVLSYFWLNGGQEVTEKRLEAEAKKADLALFNAEVTTSIKANKLATKYADSGTTLTAADQLKKLRKASKDARA